MKKMKSQKDRINRIDRIENQNPFLIHSPSCQNFSNPNKPSTAEPASRMVRLNGIEVVVVQFEMDILNLCVCQ